MGFHFFCADLRSFQNAGVPRLTCALTTNTVQSYILTLTLLRNSTCPAKKPVVFYFTSPILAQGELGNFPAKPPAAGEVQLAPFALI